MLEVVGSEGYKKASVRMVLDRTVLYRQSFYDNFANKRDCYLAAFDAGLARVEALAVDAAASEAGWRGRLRAGLGAVLDFLDSETDAGRALIVEAHAAGPEVVEKHAQAMKRIEDFIGQASLETGKELPSIVPTGVAGGFHTFVIGRLSAGAHEGFRGLLPELMYLAVLPYFGHDAARVEMDAVAGPASE